ncbi:3-dehydroquinate dehydratase II [Pseudonocardia sp. Ae168_Ps1]|uniref:type II 3-dehydroquinate dehydratase n=1 Tax=unclassified Pseudonocardia TaxID=2619320 RepID=UPI0001FFDB06|nr:MULTISPECIES: type II 3-dehydroquinate dehydratase [unclassified Pseudonocardia]ALE75695.1 3-dehydroquinate dehydratase [Pseudonocardia sp. EC080625-04]ALL82099.1 3-dehydroquinate dehydratase [Pseudonocardia sp. EC080619-01]OLL74791.1 3-dehydroquinate dehydratase II [Pseudonocardia sp. Ae150A_Ps1]OLL80783.1 3-dehydroquinate dehydratase II [Pseudonocardia sp. Ae168_Ps1]OLL85099.1 3-dehydroquinate dehydratase II [Pseudonocardia sp. Ae263_Ps1]
MTSTTTVFVFNGPNLNLLGTRKPEVYGTTVLADVEALCRRSAGDHGLALDFRQTNHEGTLVDWIHEAGSAVKRGEALGLVLNAAAYTHTSVALHDAIEGTELPTVEVHISNVHGRETFRHHSYVSPVATGIVVGFGIDGYALAIDGLVRKARPLRSV